MAVGKEVKVPEGAVEVDVEGKFVCPGLIDAHVHVTAVPGTKVREGSICSGDGPRLRYLPLPVTFIESTQICS